MRSFEEFLDAEIKFSDSKRDCALKAWQHQQSKVDELIQHIRRLESKLDSLGADRQGLVGQVDELQKRTDASLIAFEKLKEEINQLHGQCDLHLIKYLEEKSQVLEQALKGGEDANQ